MKKGVGSISQRYVSGDLDPDPHQNVTDPQHWKKKIFFVGILKATDEKSRIRIRIRIVEDYLRQNTTAQEVI
jgi:hypothetical protein